LVFRRQRVAEKTFKQHPARAVFTRNLLSSVFSAIHCLRRSVTATRTTPDRKQENTLTGGGVERHPERRMERDGQDEAAGMPLRERNEPGMANPRGP